MIKRILAMNFGGLGDEILFLPALISLKKEYPDAKITLALESRSKSIQQLTDVIDDVITVDIKSKNKFSEIFKLITKAIFGDYQMIISSGANPLISIIEAMTFIPKRYGYNTGKLSKLMLTKAVDLNKNQYAAAMYHDLVSSVTSYKTDLPQITIEKQPKIPNSVLIHPGVSLMSRQKGCIKTITSKQWAGLIDRLSAYGKHVILAGGKDDEECINEIKKYTQSQNYENRYGLTKNLTELAKLISSAEKFVCSDSAPLHIAVALDVKTYPIFGPTDDLKLVPENQNVTPLKAHDKCPLKPCLWERRKKSCDELHCLNFDLSEIARIICE
ncbi:MAG: glycosyltransferase family 9 protein [Candidatus Gastranaerophilales bacterium]|nr:glycosyltransferase family 9 protein [Candidatus Gastranaerophilales bacterium]